MIDNGVDITVDYLKLGSFLLDVETKFEGEIGLLVKRHYRVSLAYGYAELKPDSVYNNGIHEAEGTYLRVGLDYLLNINPQNNLLLGLRYGQSEYDDFVSGGISNSTFGNTPFEVRRQGLTASWFELSLSSETKVLTNFYLGGRLRVKVLKDFDKPDNINPYSLPGYGRHFDKSIPAVNLYLKYLIPF